MLTYWRRPAANSRCPVMGHQHYSAPPAGLCMGSLHLREGWKIPGALLKGDYCWAGLGWSRRNLPFSRQTPTYILSGICLEYPIVTP